MKSSSIDPSCQTNKDDWYQKDVCESGFWCHPHTYYDRDVPNASYDLVRDRLFLPAVVQHGRQRNRDRSNSKSASTTS